MADQNSSVSSASSSTTASSSVVYLAKTMLVCGETTIQPNTLVSDPAVLAEIKAAGQMSQLMRTSLTAGE